MDEFLKIAGFFAVFLSVFAVVTYMDYWAKKQKKMIQNMVPSEDIDALKSKYENEISDLQDRVATLEKIVTDGKYELKREFDKLDAA